MRLALHVAAFLSVVAGQSLCLAATPSSDTLSGSVTCTFESGTTTTYVKGHYKSASVMPISFKILAIDLQHQSASLQAGNTTVAAPLRIVRAVNANHFLEVVTEGFLNTTTIYERDPATGLYPAIHSRHFGLFGEPVVAQYYGFCKAVS